MEKIWKKCGNGHYSLYTGGRLAGMLALDNTTGGINATATIDGDIYNIVVKGFWGSEILITGSDGNAVVRVAPVTWYGSKYKVEANGAVLYMEIRNNPLADWVLTDRGTELLSYGLSSSAAGTVTVKIGGSGNASLLYDFLLWYLFLPVAREQSGDQPIFTMLLSAQ